MKGALGAESQRTVCYSEDNQSFTEEADFKGRLDFDEQRQGVVEGSARRREGGAGVPGGGSRRATTARCKSQRHVESRGGSCWFAGRQDVKNKVFLLNPIGSRGPLKVLGALSMFSF